MSACATYIARITQVTSEVINYTLFIYDRWLFFFHIQFLFNFSANTGWMVVFTFRLRSLSCSFTISAEIWFLNGKTTRTVSSVSLAGDKGRCWSQTFESTKLLMVELTRCMGYFKRENAVTRCLYQLYNGIIWTTLPAESSASHTCLTPDVLFLWIMIDVLTEYQDMAKGSPCVIE